MGGTRLDIRKFVRNKLQAWPDVATTFGAGVLIGDATITLPTVALPYVSDRALIECLDGTGEILQTIGVANPQANPINVMRGVHGGAAAIAHANGSPIQIFPFWGWTDDTINGYIDKATDWLGQNMVWTLRPYGNTWLAGNKEFGLPAGVVYPTGNIVKRIDYQDPVTGQYKQSLGWTHVGDRIILNERLVQNWVVRIWVQQLQGRLTDDVTVLDTTYAQECIELYCAARVLDELIGNRSRYYDYSAALNDRASSLDELQRAAYYMFNQATILVDKVSRPGLAGYAPIQRS